MSSSSSERPALVQLFRLYPLPAVLQAVQPAVQPGILLAVQQSVRPAAQPGVQQWYSLLCRLDDGLQCVLRQNPL